MVSTLPGGGGDDSSILALLPQCSRALSHPTGLMVACKLRTVSAVTTATEAGMIPKCVIECCACKGTWNGIDRPGGDLCTGLQY